MKSILFQLAVASILFSSCSINYIYHTTCGRNVNSQETCYVFENDTIKITYDFWADRGKMNFSVYNKLDVPIFIDWKNSSLIVDDNRFGYWSDSKVKISKPLQVKENKLGPLYGNQSFVVIKKERLTSVSPHSKIVKVSDYALRSVPNPKLQGFKMSFRNYLAYSLTEDLKVDYYVDNKFDVTKVEAMRTVPIDMHSNKDFYSNYSH